MQAHLLSLTTDSRAGNRKGPDLRLGEKERTIVAKQPVKKRLQSDEVTFDGPPLQTYVCNCLTNVPIS